jgi:hypothetical protein
MTLPATLATFFATGGPCRGLAVERRPVTLAPPDAWHASAFRAQWAGGRITVLSAIERSGVASDDAARPGALWGTREFTTDARAAAVLELTGREPEIVLINGTTVVSAGQGTALAALSQPSSILRTSSGLAPAVHPLAVHRLDGATAHRTSRALSSSS